MNAPLRRPAARGKPRRRYESADADPVTERLPWSEGETVPMGPEPAAARAVPGRAAPRWIRRLVVGTLLMAVIIVGGTAFRVWQVARVDGDRPVDAVVVLGAAQYDGEPSPVLAARLKHALALYRDGLAPRIVTVGGKQVGDLYTEAEAGRRYLTARGVPTTAIDMVDEGTDTLGSLKSVAVRAGQEGWSSVLVVSDPWHSLRARTMARDAGLDAWTSPTRSGPVVQTRETQARYIFRETGALLYYRLTHASVETENTGLG